MYYSYPKYILCAVCDKQTRAWDHRKRYCSNACRQRAYRDRKRNAREERLLRSQNVTAAA